MKSHTIATLLCASLVPALGIGHCPAGDARIFSEDCSWSLGSDPKPRPPYARLVSFIHTERLDFTNSQERLEVSNCGASLTRNVNGTVVEIFPTYEPGDIRALHDALIDAGALDAQSVPVALDGCANALSDYWNEVTVYEPSPLLGAAWSNSFSFGLCAHSQQTSVVESVLNQWISKNFDPSQPLSSWRHSAARRRTCHLPVDRIGRFDRCSAPGSRLASIFDACTPALPNGRP